MKTHYLLLSLALAGLAASCSHDDKDIKISDKSISFTASVQGSVARVAAPTGVTTTGTLSRFKVYAFIEGEKTPYMDGVEVIRDGNGWSYGPMQFWPVGKKLNFYTVSPDISTPTSPDGNIGIDARNPDIPGYVNDYRTDLLYGVNMGLGQTSASQQSGSAQVKINFRHALARVDFNFKRKDNQSIVVKIGEVTLVNTKNTGDFRFPRESTTAGDVTAAVGEWKNVTSTEDMPINTAMSDYIGATPVNLMSHNNQFVIPQAVTPAGQDAPSGIYLKVKTAIYDAASKHKVWPADSEQADIYVPVQASGNQWRAGHAYVYTISIGVPDNYGWIQFNDVTVDEYDNVYESGQNP